MGWQSTVDGDNLAILTANQLALLGLATKAEQITQTTDIPTNIQTLGTPPYIPNLKAASFTQMAPAGSPYSLVTVGAASRIWYASLSFAVATDSTYAGGADGPFSELYIQTIGEIILACQLAINGTEQALNSDQVLSLGGIPVAAGDTIFANINNGNTIADAIIRAGAVVLYTTP